ncbi:hypothetical protein [Marivirga sp.]|uniref:hypothetical protein n=1 Tax=Marivirga sp. TaxID=2018662 RepID=UPI002D7FFBD5|nr:hypothetical protein [Marivirga sp.]HET8861611.1 hypothetical protein [Marivirga sp.]
MKFLKVLLFLTLSVGFLTITSASAQDQINYGLKIGMYNYQMIGNESGRYNDIDVRIDIAQWDIYKPRFPHASVFFEHPIYSIPFVSLTTELSYLKRYLFITPIDYNPDSPFGPQSGLFFTNYRTFSFGILPAIHLNRGLETRVFAGYEVQYFHHQDKTLHASDFDDYWLQSNRRRFEVAKKFVEENPMVPFVHHLAIGAEVKKWRFGLEVKYLMGLNSPLRSVKFNDEFTYPYRSYTNSLYYSLKFYFRKNEDN